MKKISIIFLTALYMLPAIGFTINIHLCSGKISSVNIHTLNKNGGCACTEKMPTKGCCKDIHTIIKLDSNQKVSAQLTIPKNHSGKEIFGFLQSIQTCPFSGVAFINSLNYIPPSFNGKHPVYLNIRVFRI